MIVLTVGALELILMIQSARVCVGGWPAGQKRGHAIASTAGLARVQVERVMIHKVHSPEHELAGLMMTKKPPPPPHGVGLHGAAAAADRGSTPLVG